MSSDDSEDFRITRMVIIGATIVLSLLIVRYAVVDIMERINKNTKSRNETNRGIIMDRFESIEIPDGIAIEVFRWNDWYKCEFKGSTLCLQNNKGSVFKSEYIEVNAINGTPHTAAMDFAKKLRNMGYSNAS